MNGKVLVMPNLNGFGWEVRYGDKLLFQEKSKELAENKANIFAKIHGVEVKLVEADGASGDKKQL